MKKNIVIIGLLIWNVILSGVLVFVWRNARATNAQQAERNAARAETAIRQANLSAPAGEAREFTFHAGDHLSRGEAPYLIDCEIAIQATVDTKQHDGVIIAQGGIAHGYSLYVKGGELCFAGRRNTSLTTVSGKDRLGPF